MYTIKDFLNSKKDELRWGGDGDCQSFLETEELLLFYQILARMQGDNLEEIWDWYFDVSLLEDTYNQVSGCYISSDLYDNAKDLYYDLPKKCQL